MHKSAQTENQSSQAVELNFLKIIPSPNSQNGCLIIENYEDDNSSSMVAILQNSQCK